MGSVRKRGKHYFIDYYADGKRHRERAGKYKRYAELRLKDIELQRAREELRIPKDAAIDEFFENFLVHTEAHVAPKTLEKYVTVINSFEKLRSKFKSINMLSKITPPILEEYKLHRVRKVSKETVNHDLKILTIIFKWAVDQNLIKRNPAAEIRRFKVNRKNARFFSQEEIKLVLERCPDRWKPAYMILLHTGLRRKELANLEWEDVDFERRIIQIRSKEGWTPKSKRDREIPINDELNEVLLELKEKSSGVHVLERNGIKKYDRALWENFWRLSKKLEIKNANIHTFRHTFASYMIMSGVDLVIVKELLGHRDISTTMHYAHLMPNHKHWAVNRICSLTQTGAIWAQSEKFVM